MGLFSELVIHVYQHATRTNSFVQSVLFIRQVRHRGSEPTIRVLRGVVQTKLASFHAYRRISTFGLIELFLCFSIWRATLVIARHSHGQPQRVGSILESDCTINALVAYPNVVLRPKYSQGMPDFQIA